MNKSTKTWMILAAFLVIVGSSMFFGAIKASHEGISGISDLTDRKQETNTYEVCESFRAVSLQTETADIFFAPSSDGSCRVICDEQENLRYTVGVQGNTLTITVSDQWKWSEHIGIGSVTQKVTVLLPEAEYDFLSIKESTGDIEIPKGFLFGKADLSLSTGDVRFSASVSDALQITSSTGDITVEDASADALELSVSTGEVTVSGVCCRNLKSDGSTGEITLKNVNATEKITVERSTGDVHLEDVDAAAMHVKTTTGDVTGTLASGMIFLTETSTGSVNVPKTVSGGTCEVTTSTGDIYIRIPE